MDRYAQLESLIDHLDRSAARHGLVVVIDDAQWIDDSSWWLLTELVQLRGVDRMLLVLTARLPEVDRTHPRAVADLARSKHFERIVLGPMHPQHIAVHVRHLFDQAGLEGDAVSAIVNRAAGNPFFAAELARGAVTAAAGGRHSAPMLPVSVREAVRQGFHGISSSTMTALEAASILGRSFTVGLLADILGATALNTIESLQEAVDSAVLVPDDHLGSYRFAHPLIPEVIIDGLSPGSRQRLHRAAMRSIVRVHAGETDDWAGELARHAAAAFEAGDRQPAAQWAIRASEVAMDASAWHDAVRLTQHALDLGRQSIAPEIEGQLLVQLAQAAFRSAKYALAADAVERAMRVARDLGSAAMTAAAALAPEPIGAPEWDARVLRWCEIALSSGAFDPDLSACLHARLAQALIYAGDLEAADDASQQAVAESHRAPPGPGAVAAAQSRQLVCSGPDGVTERAELATDLIRAAVAANDVSSELSGRLWQLDCSLETANLAATAKALRQASQLASRVPGPTSRWLILRGRAVLLQAQGRFSAALELADDAYSSLSRSGHPGADGARLSLRAAVGRHIGHDRAATLEGLEPYEYLLRRPDEDAAGFSLLARVIGSAVHTDMGHREIAARYLESAGPLSGWRVAPYLQLEVWASVIRALAGLNRQTDLLIVYQRLRPYAGHCVASGGGTTSFLGPVALHLGIAARTVGRRRESARWLREASDICSTAGLPGFLAESQLELGLTLLGSPAAPDGTRGREYLRSAAAAAERLGMTPMHERAERALTRTANSPLTDRERVVAALVARGLTNRQIAEQLVVSERTSQNHVQHILGKLGLTNRVQVAAWWREQGNE